MHLIPDHSALLKNLDASGIIKLSRLILHFPSMPQLWNHPFPQDFLPFHLLQEYPSFSEHFNSCFKVYFSFYCNLNLPQT